MAAVVPNPAPVVDAETQRKADEDGEFLDQLANAVTEAVSGHSFRSWLREVLFLTFRSRTGMASGSRAEGHGERQQEVLLVAGSEAERGEESQSFDFEAE